VRLERFQVLGQFSTHTDNQTLHQTGTNGNTVTNYHEVHITSITMREVERFSVGRHLLKQI
jgi:hypothetical protein